MSETESARLRTRHLPHDRAERAQPQREAGERLDRKSHAAFVGGLPVTVPVEDAADDPDRDITTTVLAAAPIQLVAELGRVTLRADEVSALKGGAVISLPPNAESRVELRFGDRLWARGELVDLDGQLAVRLISVTGSRDRVDTPVADTLR